MIIVYLFYSLCHIGSFIIHPLDLPIIYTISYLLLKIFDCPLAILDAKIREFESWAVLEI